MPILLIRLVKVGSTANAQQAPYLPGFRITFVQPFFRLSKFS
jgi:hypothetical protein